MSSKSRAVNSQLLPSINTIDWYKNPVPKYIDAPCIVDMCDQLKVAIHMNYDVISLLSDSNSDCVQAFLKGMKCFNVITQVCSCVFNHPIQDASKETEIARDHANVRKLSCEYSTIISLLIEACRCKGVAKKILRTLNESYNSPGIDQAFIAEQESTVLHEYNTRVVEYNELVENSTSAFHEKFGLHLPKIVLAKEIRKRVTFV